MERMLILAMMLWAVAGTAHAQVNSQVNSGVTPSATSPAQMSCPPFNSPAGRTSAAAACDPLSVPTSTIPGSMSGATASTSGSGAFSSSTSGTGAASSTGIGAVSSISAPSSINPQAAVQLPGESANRAIQAPNTTASQAGVPSTALCSAVMPSTTGTSNPVTAFAGVSPGGC